MTIISTVVEINVAVLCASIPVFWPVLKQMGIRITVVQEVQVTSEPRSPKMAGDRSDDEEQHLTWHPSKEGRGSPINQTTSVALKPLPKL
jgi:hypothetical protein